MYQIGQAVILRNSVVFVTAISTSTIHYVTVSGLKGWAYKNRFSPAPESEILAEAVKHGWKKDKDNDWIYKSSAAYLEIMDIDGWKIVIKREPLNDMFATFGNECITADRLIKALNLAV